MNIWTSPRTGRSDDTVRPTWYIAVFFIFGLILVLRAPGFFLHSTFYAEDGRIWFADAYNIGGFRTLFLPSVGYSSVAERLSAAIAVLFPYRFAPLVMNLFGAICQFLPVPLLLSRRSRTLGPLRLRILMAIVYTLMPNNHEVFIVATNCMWHLIVATLILLVAEPPDNWFAYTSDVIIVLLSCLSGPFSLILWPLAWTVAVLRKSKWIKVLATCVTLCAVVQVISFSRQPPRVKVPLNASLHTFTRLIGGQLFLATTLGSKAWGDSRHFLALLFVALCGLTVIAMCFWRSNLAWRIFIVFAFLLLAVSLGSPLYPAAFTNLSPWLWLQNNGAERYWYLPGLAFLWACLWCMTALRPLPARLLAFAFLLLTPIGVVRDWKIYSLDDGAFKASVAQFAAAAPGQVIRVQLTPRDWYMVLVKH